MQIEVIRAGAKAEVYKLRELKNGEAFCIRDDLDSLYLLVGVKGQSIPGQAVCLNTGLLTKFPLDENVLKTVSRLTWDVEQSA